MALRKREQYLADLKKMRPNVYKFGELIQDVTTHPATRRVVESHARGIDAAHDPQLAEIFSTTSSLTGETIHRNTSLMTTSEEMIYNSKFKRKMYHLTGSCTGGLCVGWNGFNVMWSIAHEMDEALGTDYHQRVKKWGLKFQENGLLVAGALTDAKGNRALRPHQQPDLDTNLRIVGRIVGHHPVGVCLQIATLCCFFFRQPPAKDTVHHIGANVFRQFCFVLDAPLRCFNNDPITGLYSPFFCRTGMYLQLWIRGYPPYPFIIR